MTTGILHTNKVEGSSSNDEKILSNLVKTYRLKAVPNVGRVSFKQRKNLIHAIDKPQVFKSPGGTFIVFGDVKVEDLNSRSMKTELDGLEAIKKNTKESISREQKKEDILNKIENLDEYEKEESDGDLDETGLDVKDIEIIMSQTNVSRRKAVKLLRAHDGDVVSAVVGME